MVCVRHICANTEARRMGMNMRFCKNKWSIVQSSCFLPKLGGSNQKCLMVIWYFSERNSILEMFEKSSVYQRIQATSSMSFLSVRNPTDCHLRGLQGRAFRLLFVIRQHLCFYGGPTDVESVGCTVPVYFSSRASLRHAYMMLAHRLCAPISYP